MSAANTDKVRKASNGSGRPVVTTLSLAKTNGSSTAEITSATNWNTTTGVDVIMYRRQLNTTTGLYEQTTGTQTDWVGVLSGTTLSGLSLKAGTEPASGYAADGNTVVLCGPTAAWGDDFATAFLTQHNQDGTHGSVTSTGTIQAATLVATGDIQHRSISLETIRTETTFDFVASGCVWSGDSYGSTKAGSMTAGVVYIGGKRVAVGLVTAHGFTASKDTYVDVKSDGTVIYTEVSNNAASPTSLSNGDTFTEGTHIRIAIIITGASNIASVAAINQGQETKLLPIASSQPYQVTDSNGYLICPRDPQRKVLGFRQITSGPSATTLAAITGLSVPFRSLGRKVKISLFARDSFNSSSGEYAITSLWDGAVSSGTQLSEAVNQTAAANQNTSLNMSAIATISSGLHTINAGLKRSASGTASLDASSVAPCYVLIENY